MPLKGTKKEGAKRHNSEEENAYHRQRYKENRTGSFEAKLTECLYSARKRARNKGMECTIEDHHFPAQTNCSALPSTVLGFNNGREERATSLSIDRLDSAKGYTPENCWLVCDRVNRIKSDATLEELEEICRNWRAELIRRGELKP